MDNVVMGSTIKSDCCKDGVFVFDAVEVKEQVFDPVTNKILDHIEKAIKQHEEGVSGIFLSGTIGQDEYLTKLVYEKFGSVLTEVMSVKDNAFAVSKGLVQYGIRQRGSMVPYFQGKDVRSNFINSDKATVKAIVKVIDLLNEHLDIATSKPIKDEKKINHKGLDYFIGLGKH
jgi:hypothetical protein